MTVTQSEQIDQLAAALVLAQSEMEGAKKDSENPFFRSKYADLASVWLACRDALHRHGLSVVQFPGYEAGAALLTTILLHSSGQWMAGTAGAPLVEKKTKDGTSPPDAQSVGAAITYLRRFALAAVVGVVQEDDDGESAAGRGKQSAGAGRGSAGRPKESPAAPPPVQSRDTDGRGRTEARQESSRAAIGSRDHSPTPSVQPLDERPRQLTPEPDPSDPQFKELKRHGTTRALKDIPSPELLAIRADLKTKGTADQKREWLDAIDTVLASREGL